MSKSFDRVVNHLLANKIDHEIKKTEQIARTAREAAEGIGCHLNQIVKSIIFLASTSDRLILFLTAGGNSVDAQKAEKLLGYPLLKADAQMIRSRTGFAIGGVPPFPHKEDVQVLLDPELLSYSKVWAAAGTPFHVFSINPEDLLFATNAEVLSFT